MITRPDEDCTFSPVVAFVTVGIGGCTVIVAVAAEAGISPEVSPVVDSSAVKLPVASEPVVGVNFRPAAPWATEMNSPFVTGVTPSLRNSEPPAMLVI